MKIYKYTMDIVDWQEIRLPKGASILNMQIQDGIPCIWAMIPLHELGELGHEEVRTFVTVGTGHEFVYSPKVIYIGTYQLGGFVGHVFERIQ